MVERMTTKPRTETFALVAALRELARTILSDDGVANAAIAESADRIKEQAGAIFSLRYELGRLIDLLDRLRTDGYSKHSYAQSRSGDLIDVSFAIDSARSLLDGGGSKW